MGIMTCERQYLLLVTNGNIHRDLWISIYISRVENTNMYCKLWLSIWNLGWKYEYEWWATNNKVYLDIGE